MKTLSLLLTALLLIVSTATCQPTSDDENKVKNQAEHILLSRYGAFVGESEFLAPGGIISATNTTLIFTPIRTFLNQNVHITEIPLSQIKAVTRVNTFGIMPNGILLQLQDGKTQKLKTIVFRRKKLYQLLLSQTAP